MKKDLNFLKKNLSKTFFNTIIKQSKDGDIDWIIDLINELDYIEKNSTFYISAFHGKMFKLNLKTNDFNVDKIIEQIKKRISK